MKLGNLLVNIAETEGLTREQWKTEFVERVKGHEEEKLLMECYASACAGRKYLSFGRNILPPESLKDEGFILRATTCGFEYCFE